MEKTEAAAPGALLKQLFRLPGSPQLHRWADFVALANAEVNFYRQRSIDEREATRTGTIGPRHGRSRLIRSTDSVIEP